MVVYDVLEEVMEQSKHDGAKTASSPADLASKVDVVLTMLPTNQHVLDCYQGPNGVFEYVNLFNKRKIAILLFFRIKLILKVKIFFFF